MGVTTPLITPVTISKGVISDDASKKIPDASGPNKKTDHNNKIIEIDGKIPSITGLANTAALNAVENKIPDISNLVKKADYYAKILGI